MDSKIKTLAQFRATKIIVTLQDMKDNYQEEDIERSISGTRYAGFWEVLNLKKGGHFLGLERSDYEGNLERLEEILWDWAKHEEQVSFDDMKTDLSLRKEKLLSKLSKSEREQLLYLTNESLKIQSVHNFHTLKDKMQSN